MSLGDCCASQKRTLSFNLCGVAVSKESKDSFVSSIWEHSQKKKYLGILPLS